MRKAPDNRGFFRCHLSIYRCISPKNIRLHMDFPFLELIKNIAPGVIEVILVIFGFFVSKWALKIKDFFQAKLFKQSVKNSHEIRMRLVEMRATLAADRAMIWQFHNGKAFVGEGNFHNYYLSCEYESVGLGYSEELEHFQSVPISAWSSVLAQMVDKDHRDNKVFLISHDSLVSNWTWKDAGLNTFPTRLGCETALVCKLYNAKDKFVGLAIFMFEDQWNIKEIFSSDDEVDKQAQLELFLEDMRSSF
jgi:hypothetical protein